MTDILKIALGQIKSDYCDVESNTNKHIEWINEARSQNAELIVFPELSLTGYYLEEAVPWLSLTPNDPLVEELVEATEGIGAIAGLIEESPEGLFYNTALFMYDKKVIGAHRKIFLPDYGMFEEGRYFAQGNDLEVYDTPWGRLGILICEDAWHPRLAKELAHRGATIIVNMSASPVKGIFEASGIHNKELNYDNSRYCARTYGSSVIFANKVGYEHGVCFWGGSAVFSPGGEIVGSCEIMKEELKIVDCDLREVRRARLSFPYLRDEFSKEYVKL